MSEALLLRYRDLTAGVDTIVAHNTITETSGSVFWGWWKKPPELMPDPALSLMATEVKARAGIVYFINSADKTLYSAALRDIHYTPGGPDAPAPDPARCPEYYRKKLLPAWFEIGLIEKVSNQVLDEHVFSTSNRYAFNKTITAMHRADIGQVVSDVSFLDSNVSLWFIKQTADVELTERVPAVRSLSRGVWPVKGRFALHLSDLHFGTYHTYRNELGSPITPRFAKETMAEALIADLEAINISYSDIALVLITGDLTWCGDAHEFANTERLISVLTNAFGLHVSQVVVVPGNHDIEWRDEKGDVDPNAELNYSVFSRQLYGVAPDDTFLRIHQYRIANRVVCVLALNSCRLESRQNAGLGFVGSEQLGLALRFLRDITADPSQLRLALVHHHLLPVNYIEGIDAETKRGSMTLDAEAVIRNLIAAGVRVVFHGHQHQPYVSEIRRIVEGFVSPFRQQESDHSAAGDRLDGTLAVVGGGSIGVDRSHLNVVGRNCYNIIDLGNSSEITIRTRVRSPVGPGFVDYQRVSFGC
jgi:3',5'-cyclic AMP phosphodiesterase CpdA